MQALTVAALIALSQPLPPSRPVRTPLVELLPPGPASPGIGSPQALPPMPPMPCSPKSAERDAKAPAMAPKLSPLLTPEITDDPAPPRAVLLTSASERGTAGSATAIAIAAHIAEVNRRLTPGESNQLAQWVEQIAAENDVDPFLLAALISRESSFNARAVSSSGAIGLGQLMPDTAAGLGVDDPYDAEENLRGVGRLLRSLMDAWNSEPSPERLALASYRLGLYGVRHTPPEERGQLASDFIDGILSLRDSLKQSVAKP